MDVKNSKKKVIAGIVVCSLSVAANASESKASAEKLSEIDLIESVQEFESDNLLIEEIKPGLIANEEPPTKKRHRAEPDPWWRSLWNSITTGGKDSQFS